MNPDWKKYTCSNEQKKELKAALSSCCNGVLLKFKDGTQRIITSHLYAYEFVEYLICQPNPLADMICQQARTGQPVWVRYEYRDATWPDVETFVTNTPDWYIPTAEYSFTPFKEEK